MQGSGVDEGIGGQERLHKELEALAKAEVKTPVGLVMLVHLAGITEATLTDTAVRDYLSKEHTPVCAMLDAREIIRVGHDSLLRCGKDGWNSGVQQHHVPLAEDQTWQGFTFQAELGNGGAYELLPHDASMRSQYTLTEGIANTFVDILLKHQGVQTQISQAFTDVEKVRYQPEFDAFVQSVQDAGCRAIDCKRFHTLTSLMGPLPSLKTHITAAHNRMKAGVKPFSYEKTGDSKQATQQLQLKNGCSEKEISAWIDSLGHNQAYTSKRAFTTLKSALKGLWNPKRGAQASPLAVALQKGLRDKQSSLYEAVVVKGESKGNVSTLGTGLKNWLIEHDVAVWMLFHLEDTADDVLAHLSDQKQRWRQKSPLTRIERPRENYFEAQAVSLQHSIISVISQSHTTHHLFCFDCLCSASMQLAVSTTTTLL